MFAASQVVVDDEAIAKLARGSPLFSHMFNRHVFCLLWSYQPYEGSFPEERDGSTTERGRPSTRFLKLCSSAAVMFSLYCGDAHDTSDLYHLRH